MLTSAFFDFFKDLSQNNNTDWFHANKPRYEKAVKQPFQALVQEIIDGIPDLNIQPKEAIYRINRDIRFSQDKSPYKLNVAASFSKMGKNPKDFPAYYLHIEYGMIMIGGGNYFMEKDTLQKLRWHIYENTQDFKNAIHSPDFVEKYGKIRGEVNKKVSAPFNEIQNNTLEIMNKQVYFLAELDPKLALQSNFKDLVLDYFHAAKPLITFLEDAYRRQ